MVNNSEIANRLQINVEFVNKSPSIQNTYKEISENPNMSQREKEDAFDEMAKILKDMLEKK
ncbi:MAG TPA: hypothetical protein GXZ78_04085 [Eubacteriaceae bacterium]|nr:hypothetical protein [Eubacteriaceae bacterium]